MKKYKLGAIVKEVQPGAEYWYIRAGWKEIKEEPIFINKKNNEDKTNSKEPTNK